MPPVNAAALAALGQTVVAPVYFAFLDFLGDPLRATSYGKEVTFSGSSDPELDGTYSPFDPRFVSVSDVTYDRDGSDTVTVALSGIIGIDSATLNIIGDRSKWFRRTARLWMQVRDENDAAQGAIIPYKTGYMTDARIVPSPEFQTIEIDIENYLVLLREASRRTYLDQADYDSGDLSAKASVGATSLSAAGPAKFGGGRRLHDAAVGLVRRL